MLRVRILSSAPVILKLNIKNGLLAQLVEQLTLNQRVVGSSPSQSTILSKNKIKYNK